MGARASPKVLFAITICTFLGTGIGRLANSGGQSEG